MCVWPTTTVPASTPANEGATRSSGVPSRKMSVSFCGVAWQNSASADSVHLELQAFGQPVEKRDLVVAQLVAHPPDHVRRRQAPFVGVELAVGVAANPPHALAESEAARAPPTDTDRR